MSRIIGLDFETFYTKKKEIKYTVTELGNWRYCADDRFDPYLISVSDGEQSWAGHPRDFNWDSLTGATLVSHNRSFDSMVQRMMVEKGMAPKLDIADWVCSADLSTYLCNRRNLKSAAEFLLGERLSKEARDDANGKHWEDIVRDGKGEQMLEYARSDAARCRELFVRYGHLWPDRERRLSDLTTRQGARGIQINVDRLKEYIVIATQMLAAAEATLPWIEEGKKPTSPKAIAEECRRAGIPCPPVKSHFDDGEERFVAWEAAYGGKHVWIANVSNWRSINKFLESLLTIQERMDGDGIFRFSLKYFGAHTGRWSGDSGFNMQNLRKAPIFRDEKGLMIADEPRLKEIENSKTMPSFVTAVLDIRSLFIPRRGKKMIISDLSQIEPRVLAWLVKDERMLELMRSGMSPYESHARATMNWTGGEMKKEDKGLYALAKARVLGLGFQCGWEKFINVAQIMAGLDITKDDPEFVQATNLHGEPCFDGEGKPIMISGWGSNSKRIVKDYREQNPAVVALWKQLDTGFKDSAGGHFEVELPSGRSMRYLDVRKERRMVRDEETGQTLGKTVTTALIGERRFVLYGGLLTENLVQATARDVFGEQCVELDRTSGIDVLFTAHDEAVNEVDEGITKEDVSRVMSKPPEWMPGLPVACEAIEAPHYLK